ncbi:hypothetical protein CN229_29005 [Sinorhizobium meliloti]|nr:hypothetical protein CN229_29005 [Sinorhizobium meliloti]RVG32158.1 hypothetical protein CN225_19900 [Sinorhizobium meliloti]RVG56482.1 hypothetical protein CN224_19515 [Sinorhizobium meliloti]RVI75255.1 hypothetical protein CN191_21235 [Sinorhizobium meliloti]RVL32354.1 hypothetical protein CN148_24650 [Sinorhizobium meliloti]
MRRPSPPLLRSSVASFWACEVKTAYPSQGNGPARGSDVYIPYRATLSQAARAFAGRLPSSLVKTTAESQRPARGSGR